MGERGRKRGKGLVETRTKREVGKGGRERFDWVIKLGG